MSDIESYRYLFGVSEYNFLEGANCGVAVGARSKPARSPVGPDAGELFQRVSELVLRVVLAEDEIVDAAVGDEDNCTDVIETL